MRLTPAAGLAGRREPDPAQGPVIRFNGLTRLVVMERRGDWARVRLPDGVGGAFWVDARGLLEPDSPEASHPPPRVVPADYRPFRPQPTLFATTVVMPTPTGRYRAPRTHGGIAGALLVGVMLVASVAFAATLVTIQAFDRVEEAPFPSALLELETADERRVALTLAVLGFVLASYVALIVWTRRVYRNLPAIGSPIQRYRPGWAVGGWFVPILGLWRPKAILNDVWRGSDPTSPSTPGERWEVPRRVDPVLDIWWVAWIGSSVTLTIASRLDISTSPRVTLVWVAIFLAAEACSAALGLWVVQRLTRRQEQRAAKVVAPQVGAAAPVPADSEPKSLAKVAKRVAVPALGAAAAAIAFVSWSAPNPVRAVPGSADGGAGIYSGHGVQFEYPGDLPAQESGLLGGEATASDGVVVAGDDAVFISVAWLPNFGVRSTRRDFESILDSSLDGLAVETGMTTSLGEVVETELEAGRFLYQSWVFGGGGEMVTGVLGVTECVSLQRVALIQVVRSDGADLNAVLDEFLTLAGTIEC